jgi:hypothetical protein
MCATVERHNLLGVNRELPKAQGDGWCIMWVYLRAGSG